MNTFKAITTQMCIKLTQHEGDEQLLVPSDVIIWTLHLQVVFFKNKVFVNGIHQVSDIDKL